ncbi:hypothetical protein RHMOL_Rhmol02G0157600 [Rhododendron molle]|uniref:Uncharacterized protein n=1 Tax=Rhododendron molle TaxID=49168 RepID=A0ACC0PTN2_RHOML|nr:hypothetical protein RHMOL_Rhmol02G0157600 [Rhododendron molle]
MDSISLSLGIDVVLGTRVKSADVKQKTLLTATGETISYKFLIIATGARALKLEEFGLTGSDAGNVCYLRDLADATRLVDVMQSCIGGNAVVFGGGYIGMECAASLVINKLNVTMVFPEAHTKTTVKQIEEAFKEFTTREDIAIVMISQYFEVMSQQKMKQSRVCGLLMTGCHVSVLVNFDYAKQTLPLNESVDNNFVIVVE